MIGTAHRLQYSTTAQKFVKPQELAQLRAAHEGGDQVELGSPNDHVGFAANLVRSVVRAPEAAEGATYKTLLNPSSGRPAYYVFGVASKDQGRRGLDQVVIKSDYSQAFLYRDK